MRSIINTMNCRGAYQELIPQRTESMVEPHEALFSWDASTGHRFSERLKKAPNTAVSPSHKAAAVWTGTLHIPQKLDQRPHCDWHAVLCGFQVFLWPHYGAVALYTTPGGRRQHVPATSSLSWSLNQRDAIHTVDICGDLQQLADVCGWNVVFLAVEKKSP